MNLAQYESNNPDFTVPNSSLNCVFSTVFLISTLYDFYLFFIDCSIPN